MIAEMIVGCKSFFACREKLAQELQCIRTSVGGFVVVTHAT
jgi:hypothetical protein